jgi:hypothetical protein
MTDLLLRRTSVSRPSDEWNDDDFDIYDGERDVGRIYRINAATKVWGVSFMVTGRKSYGTADTLDEAKAAFKAEYERWQQERS